MDRHAHPGARAKLRRVATNQQRASLGQVGSGGDIPGSWPTRSLSPWTELLAVGSTEALIRFIKLKMCDLVVKGTVC